MIDDIKNSPHKILTSLSVFFGIIGIIIWKYDKMVGYSSGNQTELEQFWRFIFGTMIMFIPFFLVYALIYWLMYKFNKPTNPTLNFWHFGLLFLSIAISLFYGYILLFTNSYKFKQERSIMEYLLLMISYSIPVIFIINIILSLLKHRKV